MRMEENEFGRGFDDWKESAFPVVTDPAKNLIRKIPNLGPAKRVKMPEIVEAIYRVQKKNCRDNAW